MSLNGVQLHLVERLADAEDFMRWLGQSRRVLGVDTETTGFSAYKQKIRLIQFGDTRTGWAMSWDLWKGLAMEALERYEGPIAFHNMRFDGAFIEHHSNWRIPRERSHDTMLMAHVVNPLGSGALKSLAARHVDRRALAGQNLLDEAFKKHGWDWATVPINFPAYWQYSALDPVLTCGLWEHFIEHCGVGGKYDRVYALEMATRHTVSAMERNGIPLDVDYSVLKAMELRTYAEEVADWCKGTFGIANPGSNPQLVKKFTDLGAEITQFTGTGAPSVNKYQLAIFTNEGSGAVQALAQQVLRMRKAAKTAQYFENFVEHSIDGVVHPEIRTLGARTGRMSVSNPALQQVPKGDATVRRAFLPSEGNKIVTCDYSQIEMRLLAHFSQDGMLIDAFKNADAMGGDFFVSIGRDVYNDPEFAKSDKRRGLIKSTMYGKAYGAGINKMAETAGVAYATMEAVVHGLDAKYPGIRAFTSDVENIGFRRQRDEGQGYVMTPLGRRLPCDDGHVYALTNYLIQSTAAEVFKESLVRLDHLGLTDYMALPVHDEVVFNMPVGDIEQARHEIPYVMSDMKNYLLELTTEFDGPLDNWGQKYAIKPVSPTYESI
jgi:DNA polymerase-1